ncbi:zinc-binding dehydrogenase [Patulibacter sp.]|uniref:zinc-binding dehydrogenase n=1 Tax=Patulibacter sp. TaxID=1912859 RepID=UPI00272763E6|nr:zinc-binding dehydrogenase [Patulibacter sp.]MDO9409378.1 zinc-binding dehydrogenase [Patulibacter sp.]
MRAVVCQNTELSVQDLPEPTPARGQVRLEVVRCGVCGSDLHARHGFDDWADMAEGVGYERFGRVAQPVVLGHEFCGRVAEYGPGTKRTVPEDTPVVALPMLRNRDADAIDLTGLSRHAPGAYAEQVLVEASLMLPVPNGLDPEIAALTEPMAVAHHAVLRGEVGKRQTAVVVGCGPVGLGVILMLKAQGVRTVVASDPSAGRRALATRCGADVVVDPTDASPWEAGAEKHLRSIPATLELAVGTIERMSRLPVGWWHLWRAADRAGLATPPAPVVFECVGVPGILQDLMAGAPMYSRIVVVGVCVGEDRITPAMGINKEIDLRFVFGYTPLEFRDTLHQLADGTVDPRPLITGTVGLEGVGTAFAALGDDPTHAKVLVDPRAVGSAVLDS